VSPLTHTQYLPTTDYRSAAVTAAATIYTAMSMQRQWSMSTGDTAVYFSQSPNANPCV